ncbi:unnamed protein product, partial [Discosporangium mesarthrocarpum]
IPISLYASSAKSLNALYKIVAGWLTDLENHRTEKERDDALMTKRFLFEAFDSYISLFYLAFVQVSIE